MEKHFENISISMRFILPSLMAVFFYAYSQDQNRLHAEMTDIKDTEKAIWNTMETANKKTACINQNVAKCCPNSVVCY